MPEDHHLLLYLLPSQLLVYLEEYYLKAPKGMQGSVEYMSGFMDLILDICAGSAPLDKDFTHHLRNTIKGELMSYFERPTSRNMQNVLAKFVLENADFFEWNLNEPLVTQCTEWLKKKTSYFIHNPCKALTNIF